MAFCTPIFDPWSVDAYLALDAPEIALGVGFRFWRCHLYGPASRRGGGLIEALLGGRSLRPKQVAEGMQHTVKGLLCAFGGRHWERRQAQRQPAGYQARLPASQT